MANQDCFNWRGQVYCRPDNVVTSPQTSQSPTIVHELVTVGTKMYTDGDGSTSPWMIIMYTLTYLGAGEITASRSCARSEATHKIYIKTGIKRGSEAEASVFIQLRDIKGEWSSETQLNTSVYSFQQNTTDLFYINAPSITKVDEIILGRRHEDEDDSWFVELVTITEVLTKRKSLFPLTRWISHGVRIVVSEYDYKLPSQDNHAVQRSAELQKEQQLYKLAEMYPGLPLKLAEIFPRSEGLFIEDYEGFKNQTRTEIDLLLRNPAVFLGEFESLDDIEDIFITGGLPLPKGMFNWKSDVEFGKQRLVGVNPMEIELCTEIPDKLAVTSHMLEPFLEGKSLEERLISKKIFIVDHTDLLDIAHKDGLRIPAPYALFYQKENGELVPIAIQLMPEPGADNPVFLPSDPEYTWLLAKMWFNLADSSVHQSAVHLGLTHFLMESVAVSTHRQLSPSHPIYQLLVPHFHQLMAIDNLGRHILVNPGGYFDQLLSVGRTGAFMLIQRRWEKWSWEKNGNFTRNFEKRGLCCEVLPGYYYRDDAVQLWEAISKYVTKIVENVYTKEDMILDDPELQGFLHELSSPTGVNLRGFPRALSTTEELVEVLSFIIFSCSVQHTAINLGQYDQYAFALNYPAMLLGEPPQNKSALSEIDVIRALPSKPVVLRTIAVTRTLAASDGNPLGNFEIPYAYHPSALEALDQFNKDLKKIGRNIDKRNDDDDVEYITLHPNNVPNSIND